MTRGYMNRSMLCCVQQLCIMICAHTFYCWLRFTLCPRLWIKLQQLYWAVSTSLRNQQIILLPSVF